MARINDDGTETSFAMPNHRRIKSSTLRAICTQASVTRVEFLRAVQDSQTNGAATLDIREAIDVVVSGRSLSLDDASAVMRQMMLGEASPAQLGAFLTALRLKGEATEEIAGMATVMREFSLKVNVEGMLVDSVGTGGDGQNTFNISTAAAFVAAGAGLKVAKHGNRAASGKCGAADVLEALGVRIDLPPEGVERCINEGGIGFMFAPAFHPSMRHAAPVRREIGIRTVFNILGPSPTRRPPSASLSASPSPSWGSEWLR